MSLVFRWCRYFIAYVVRVTLAFAGNRIGVGLDKAELEERQREQDDRFNELLEKYYEEKERRRTKNLLKFPDYMGRLIMLNS